MPRKSIYEEALEASVNVLPITQNKKDSIRRVGLRKIKDVLLDTELVRLRSARGIGRVWAAKIKNSAEEYVSGV